MDDVGIVVIGRNEGERLRACLASVAPLGVAVVYVDSASSDGSPELARSMGAHAIELSADQPMTAARGRQHGLDWLGREHPGVKFVLFIDGDCIWEQAFVAEGRAFLLEHADYAGVCAKRYETRTAESFWSRLIDIDWDVPPGDVAYVGGDAMYRVTALDEAGGWSMDLIAGEEPDRCFRLAALPSVWKFRRIPGKMTGHDIAMTHTTQYLRRFARTGHAYAQVGWRHRKGAGRRWWRSAISMSVYALVLPAIAIAGGWLHWAVPLVILAMYVALVFRVYRWVRLRGGDRSLALAYAVFNLIGKFAGPWGMLRYFWSRLIGRRTPLMEYHRPSPTMEETRG